MTYKESLEVLLDEWESELSQSKSAITIKNHRERCKKVAANFKVTIVQVDSDLKELSRVREEASDKVNKENS